MINPTYFIPLQMLPTPNTVAPSAVTWTFPQPMQLQVTTPLNANNNYYEIAKDFLEKFASTNLLGIAATANYYNTNAFISLHIHQGSNNYLYEIVGHTNLQNKFGEMGVNQIKYSSMVFTCQPIGKSKLLIVANGKAEINDVSYNIMNTFVVRIVASSNHLYGQSSIKIINQVFEVFQ